MKTGFVHIFHNTAVSFFLTAIFLLACHSQSVKSYVDAADQLVLQRDIAGAVRVYHRAIQDYPRASVLYINQAALLTTEKKLAHAIRNYEVVKKLNPESFWPYLGLGRVLALKEDFEGARQALKDGLKQCPHHPSLLFHLGQVYYFEGNGGEALTYFNKALDAKYKHRHKVYHYRGLTFERLLHNVKRAKLDYESYLLTDFKGDKTEVKKLLEQIDETRYDF
ncbi:MAG: tetratricopeptide repeat protein [Deltaproteobacteria bacterium]|nr:tetratricopeptide repeat protein [Deltaproteobacteria bacterium]